MFTRSTRRRKYIYVVVLATVMTLAFAGVAQAATYYVQPGDTLYLIGLRYDLSPWQMMQNNGLTTSTIYPGQKLWVPDGGGGFTYTVQPGDTLFLMGQRFGVSYQSIMSANKLSSDYILPGTVLWIPTGQASAPASAAPADAGAARPAASTASRAGSNYREDLDLLAHVVYAEARGEPYAGQVAVAAVVLNRLKDARFPKTVRDVIFEPWAFTCVTDGQFFLTPNSTAYNAARDALAGWDPSGGALYYWNPAYADNSWVWSRPIITTIGSHVFAL